MNQLNIVRATLMFACTALMVTSVNADYGGAMQAYRDGDAHALVRDVIAIAQTEGREGLERWINLALRDVGAGEPHGLHSVQRDDADRALDALAKALVEVGASPRFLVRVALIYRRLGDRAKYEQLVRRSAELGDAAAAWDYFVITRKTEPAESLQWLRRAAEGGDYSAQRYLARGHLGERGTDFTVSDGFARFLGPLHHEAQRLIERDPKKAFAWYVRIAESLREKCAPGASTERRIEEPPCERRPDLGARAFLGWLYLEGLGTPADYQQARRIFEEVWKESTADGVRGDSLAARGMARIYSLGLGVDRDDRTASEWWRRVRASSPQPVH